MKCEIFDLIDSTKPHELRISIVRSRYLHTLGTCKAFDLSKFDGSLLLHEKNEHRTSVTGRTVKMQSVADLDTDELGIEKFIFNKHALN